MKISRIKLASLAAALLLLSALSGCGGGDSENQDPATQEEGNESVNQEATTESVDKPFVNSSYDAKVDGGPNDIPKSIENKDEPETEDNYVPFVLPEVEKES